MKKILCYVIIYFLLGSSILCFSSEVINVNDTQLISDDNEHWKNLFEEDFCLTNHSENEGTWDPDVAYTDDMFFITWEEGIPKSSILRSNIKIQIRGCFFSKHGERIGEEFGITPWYSNKSTFRCEDPAVVYGEKGSERCFFIAYEYYNDPEDDLSRDIKGALVPFDAKTIDDVKHFDICTLDNNQDDPSVGFDKINNNFFVIWADARKGHNNYNIYGKYFDIYGNELNEITLTNNIKNNCEPAFSFNDKNGGFLVVWEHAENAEYGPFEIWGRLFNISNKPVSEEKLLSYVSTENIDYNFPHVAYCEKKNIFLVEWQKDDWSEGDDLGPIYGIFIDSNGKKIDEQFLIIDGEYKVNDIDIFSDSLFLITFDNYNDIFGKFVSSEGYTCKNEVVFSADSKNGADWASIYCLNESVIVLWEDLRIEYPPPYESLNLPDVFLNIWSFSNQPPSIPDSPVGDPESKTHFSVDFTTKGYDFEGDKLQYYFEWGDGSGIWTNFINNFEECTFSHIWREPDTYLVRCKARDEYFLESNWSEEFEIIINNNNNDPPETPTYVNGQTVVIQNHTHLYHYTTSDPNNHDVQLCFNWGDGSSIEETPFYESDKDQIDRDHTWTEPGIYEIEVLAKDEYGACSYWSDKIIVTCSKDNNPPSEPEVTGPEYAAIYQDVEFYMIANDPDGNKVNFWVNWGDCDQDCTSVYGPYASGDNITIHKTWYKPGNYEIEITARDEANEPSNKIMMDIKISIFKFGNHLISNFINNLLAFLENNNAIKGGIFLNE